MTTNKTGLDLTVELIQSDDVNGDNSSELISLIEKEPVNSRVDGLALISYYLNYTSSLDIGVLETFASTGHNLNVQDDRGRTPFHWLLGHQFNHKSTENEQCVLSLVELFLAKGADPCLLDNDGNNVLMVAVLFQQIPEVYKALVDHMAATNPSHLFEHTNKMGFDVLSLCFKSNVLISDVFSVDQLEASMDKLDHNGNNVLHNLYLKPPDKYQPTVTYRHCTLVGTIGPGPRKKSRQTDTIVSNLEHLIEAGANISQKNNDGLVPLQVALLSFDAIESYHLKQLFVLRPSKEVLLELVPLPDSIIGTILTKYSNNMLPLVEQLASDGLNCSTERVLQLAMASKDSTSDLLNSLIRRGGAKIAISDIKYALEQFELFGTNRDQARLRYLLENVPGSVVVGLTDAIPRLMVVLCNTNNLDSYGLVRGLLRRGLVLKVEHYHAAIANNHVINCVDFIGYMTPALGTQLNALRPNLIEQMMNLNVRGFDSSMVERLVRKGISLTVENILLAFTKQLAPFELLRLVKLATTEVRGQLKEVVPDAIGRVLKFRTHSPGRHHMSYYNETELFQLLIDIGYKITADNIVQLFHSLVPLKTMVFLVKAADQEVKGQLKFILASAIGRVIKGWSLIVSDEENVNPVCELIDILVANGIDVSVDDLKHGLETKGRGSGLALNPNCGSPFPVSCLIKNMDIKLKSQINKNYADLLVRVTNSGFHQYDRVNISHIVDTLDILLNKFKLDINYSNSMYGGTVLHNLIDLCSKFQLQKDSLDLIVDYVLEITGIKIDLKVPLRRLNRTTRVKVSPIDLALELNQFEVVNKLIIAGADCRHLIITQVVRDTSSLNTRKLLYMLGHYLDIADDEHILEWSRELPVRSLHDLTSMAVRRDTTQTELNQLVNQVVLPQKVLDNFKFKHVALEPKHVYTNLVKLQEHANGTISRTADIAKLKQLLGMNL